MASFFGRLLHTVRKTEREDKESVEVSDSPGNDAPPQARSKCHTYDDLVFTIAQNDGSFQDVELIGSLRFGKGTFWYPYKLEKGIEYAGMNPLAEALTSNDTLLGLRFCYGPLSTALAQELSLGITQHKHGSTLESVSFIKVNVEDGALCALAPSLKGVQRAVFRSCKVHSMKQYEEFFGLLSNSLLTAFSLIDVRLDVHCLCKGINRFLLTNRFLEVFSLQEVLVEKKTTTEQRVQTTIVSVGIMLKCAKYVTNLKDINLDHCFLDDAGMIAFASILGESRLTGVALRATNTGITDPGVFMLSRLLKGHESVLSKLTISENAFTAVGMKALCSSLPYTSTLESLFFMRVLKVQKQAALALAIGIIENSSLVLLTYSTFSFMDGAKSINSEDILPLKRASDLRGLKCGYMV